MIALLAVLWKLLKITEFWFTAFKYDIHQYRLISSYPNIVDIKMNVNIFSRSYSAVFFLLKVAPPPPPPPPLAKNRFSDWENRCKVIS